MGFAAAALFTVFTAADNTIPARAVHYGRMAEGWVLSRFIHKGMRIDEVTAILGPTTSYIPGSIPQIADFSRFGVSVHFNGMLFLTGHPVDGVSWEYRPFRPEALARPEGGQVMSATMIVASLAIATDKPIQPTEEDFYIRVEVRSTSFEGLKEKLKLKNDGTAVYSSHRFRLATGPEGTNRSFTLTREQMADLERRIDKAEFWTLRWHLTPFNYSNQKTETLPSIPQTL